MIISRISAHLIALCVISLATRSFGNLTSISGLRKNIDGQPGREFNCTSADDGAALILNFDLRSSPAPSKTSQNQDHWCPPNEQNECIKRWDYWEAERVGNWSVTNPWDHPMGPVFDHRWEGFKEYSAKSEESRIPVRSVRESGTIVFSARGLNYMKLLLCNRNESCSQIIISAESENGSLNHTCPNNASKFTKPRKNYEEDNSDAEANHPFISEYVWRTFILRWDKYQMNIAAANNTASILQKGHDPQKNITDLFVSSVDVVLVRFHSYEYLRTTKPDTELTSYDFYHSEQYFCVEMLVSLCSECKLEVRIVDFEGKQNWLIGNIDGANQSTSDKLPSWQYVKQNATLKKFKPANVKIQISTRIHQSKIQGRWAMDGFRQCPSVGAERTYRSFIPDVRNGDEYNQPNVRCQKLSYEGKSVVKQVSKDHHDVSKKCQPGTYGYNCQQHCGQCRPKTCSQLCGLCQHGCDDHYLPPSCKIKLGMPAVSYGYRTTSFRLNFSTQPNEEVIRNLTFQLKVGKAHSWTEPSTKSKNLSIFEITTDGLSLGADYTLQAVMQVRTANKSWVTVKTPEKKFCNGMNGQTMPMDPTSHGTTSMPDAVTDEIPERSNSWIAILLILAICFFVSYIWRRKLLNAVRRMRRQDLASYWPAVTYFVKSATTCTFHNTSPWPVAADTELSGIVSVTESVSWNRYSHPVNIKDFEDYVKDSIASGLLKSQFIMFPRGLNRPCKYGTLPQNKAKNRYSNIVAYDDSRVILKKIPGDPYSDYINANYVEGFRKTRSYIAAQGPKPQTLADFWRMIWQEETLVICMLANVVEGQKVKCEQYWPDFGASQMYGDIDVMTVSHQIFADYTFRTFQVSCKDECRKITHLHYTGWPDHTVPMYSNSVIAYLKKLLTTHIGKGPIVVHCSAGVGRTGTVILCDICLHRAVSEGAVDVLAEMKKLRESRLNMVDNELQYMFAHIVLAECLIALPTELPCNNELPKAIEERKKELPQHIERLRETVWQDQLLHFKITPGPPLPEQREKNRFPELAPVSPGLVYLERYPRNCINSDYISAVIVDGLKIKKQYLASQLPLPSTLSDFWRLVAEQRIELVIILQQPDPADPTCCDIIPGEEPFNPVPFINLELKSTSESEKTSRTDELLLTDTSAVMPRTQQVTMLTCPGWGVGKGGKPPPPNKLVELWIASENIHREKGPTLILCHDGVTGCGLYLALSFLLERMAVERECDIILAVRAIRRSRKEFVQSQEQFEYLYDAASEYIEYFEDYANFA